jgi:murein DD-endopeptidase MepM/ murein hydrolase activator NlpD
MDDSMLTARSFHMLLVSTNNLGQKAFKEWSFRPGMLFNAKYKWWGDAGARTSPHEGLDIGFFRTATSEICSLPEGAKVPAIFDGEVVKVCEDFLGKSIFVRHQTLRMGTSPLFTIYGHTKPCPSIDPAMKIAEGDVIATVADAGAKGVSVPSHLHISLAWIPDGLPPEVLDWKYIGERSGLVLLDPLTVLGLPHSVVY